jgi:hypothetical protein
MTVTYTPTRGRSATTGDPLPCVWLDITEGDMAGWSFSLWWPGTYASGLVTTEWSCNWCSPGDETDPIRTRYLEDSHKGPRASDALATVRDLWPEIAMTLIAAANRERAATAPRYPATDTDTVEAF